MICHIDHQQVDQSRQPFDGEPVTIRHYHHLDHRVRWCEATWIPAYVDMDDETDEDNSSGSIEGGFFRTEDFDEVELYQVTHWIARCDLVDDIDSDVLEARLGREMNNQTLSN